MGKISLQSLFTDKRGTQPTRDWAKLVRDNKDNYANCRVVSFTRVKDLNSKWKHEYVQFIVEENDSKERARIYAERGNEVKLDWVTFGPAETRESGSKDADDLPLPLTSLVFDEGKRPTVLEIAEILGAATTVGGPYELFGHSCFWYAYTTYDAVKLSYGKQAKEKQWHWFDIGGAGGAGAKDAMGLGWTTLFKFYYVSDANKFKKDREEKLEFMDGETREIVGSDFFVNKIASNMDNDEYRASYIKAMKEQGVELSDAEVKELLRNSEKQVEKEAGANANWTKEFDNANNETVERVLATPSAENLIEIYNDFAAASNSAGAQYQPLSEVGIADNMESAVSQTADAIKVVVASILKEAGRTN